MTVFFNSNSKDYHMLSNFSSAPITIAKAELDPSWAELNPSLASFFHEETLEFLSVEHLWHALKATDRETFLQFAVGGRFGSADVEAFAAVFCQEKAEQKQKWWMKKNNVGIIPKMAANFRRGTKLGIKKKMQYERERPSADVERRVWLALLERKYKQNGNHAAVLKKTCGRRLIEFARSAAITGSTEHWGGCIVDGKLRGENVMGQYMEETRNKLFPNG